ncbi:MAG TPA: LysR family transcriptional regulator [Roseiarcus sp.]|nr:LysR family transcriptional regulator [Roseiarcus sp.]
MAAAFSAALELGSGMHAAVLRYLDSVARFGSIRRAAESLNVASSAVNRQILKLEAEIGAPLFERRGNGVRLTAAGDYMLRHSRATLADWSKTRAEIAALTGDIRGEVRLISIPSLLVSVVPQAISALAKRHPHISFRVVDADPEVHVAEMRTARPDIATLFIDRRHRHYEALARLHLALGAIMRPDHPLAGAKSLTLTQCASYPVVMLNDPWLLDAASETEFIRSGAQFNARIKSNSLILMKQAMRDGLGIGFFTPTGFVDELASGELVHVPLAERGLANSEIGLLVHRERMSTPHISLAAKALARAFEDFAARLAAQRGNGSGSA